MGHRQDAEPKRKTTKTKIEAALGTKLIHGWHLDGAGPARFGWAAVYPCRVRFLGRSLAEVAASI